MLCDLCKCVFSGNGEPSPEGQDEYLHHRSSRSLAIALAEGCQLCLILQDLLPEHMFTSHWEYRFPDQGCHPATKVSDLLNSRDNTESATITSEHATRTFPYRSRNSFYRRYYVGGRGGKATLHAADPADRHFALTYFRSATVDNLPTVEFLTFGSAGRAAISGLYPLKILLCKRRWLVTGEPKIPCYNAQFGSEPCTSSHIAEVGPEEEAEDYRFRSSSTSDMSAWCAARSWLSNCARNHLPSCAVRSKTFLPSRLVYLEDATTSQSEQTVKLFHTAELMQTQALPPPYMTLSHRWNNASEQFTLRSTNIGLFSAGIPLTLLSQTFRDALRFASFCNAKFVWIDALCIVQDDVEDWAREAPLMGSIYYNAVCNLNAAGSEDLMHGLSSRRSPRHSAPLLVSPNPDLWNTGDSTTIGAQEQYVCVAQDFWERNINQAAVNQRAWVMQERLLSVRKIFFSDHQLFWECRQKQACEAFPGGIPGDSVEIYPRTLGRHLSGSEEYMISTIDALIRQQRCGGMRAAATPEARMILLVAWGGLLQRYTSYGLSYAKDRLMAIKGITSYLETALDDECIHGLWRKELPYQLFFMYFGNPVVNGIRTHIKGNVNVPTWSWAHLDKGLMVMPEIDDPNDDTTNQDGRKAPLISVLEILDTLPLDLEVGGSSGEDLNRPLRGCLHLKCHLFSCSVDPKAQDKNTDSHLHVLMHLGDRAYQAHLVFDGRWPDNACIMPVFWHEGSHGKAIVVSRIGDENSPMTFTRTGFLGATAVFWSWFQINRQIAEEQDIWLV